MTAFRPREISRDTTYPIWFFPYIKECHLAYANNVMVFIPMLTSQVAVVDDEGEITGIEENGTVSYEVGKVGYMRYWIEEKQQARTYLVSIWWIHTCSVRTVSKRMVRTCGFRTVTQFHEAYAKAFGADAIDALAWQIMFTRVNKHRGKANDNQA